MRLRIFVEGMEDKGERRKTAFYAVYIDNKSAVFIVI